MVGDAQEIRIASLLRRVIDDAYVHHDVDEQAILSDKRPQVLALLFESFGQRLSRLHHDLVDGGVPGQVIPPFPGRPEEEAQVMYCTIHLAVLDELAVVFGFFSPPYVFILLVNQPELAAKKAFTPVCPRFTRKIPTTIRCVYWELVRVNLNQFSQLYFSKFKRRINFGKKLFSGCHIVRLI